MIRHPSRERAAENDGKLANDAEAAHVGDAIIHAGNAVEEAVSAAEANRRFSRIMRGVREGDSYLVTSHGRPVARIVPADGDGNRSSGARMALLSRLGNQPIGRIGRWTRDELYENER